MAAFGRKVSRGLRQRSCSPPAAGVPPAAEAQAPAEPAEQAFESLVEVFLRVRPHSARERGEPQCIRAQRSFVNVSEPSGLRELGFGFEGVIDSSSGASDQESVFRAVGERAVQSLKEGFHTCVFSLGQTGTGKTYTLLGTPQEPGLLPRIVNQLLDSPQPCRVSCLELYMDRVRDLLADDAAERPSPEIRCHPDHGVYVSNLSEVAVDDAQAALKLVQVASRNRCVARTSMNAASSRGHTVYRLALRSGARLCIVDLAGRENERTTGCHGQSLAELGYINKSLFHLTSVLQALAATRPGKSPRSLVPFRNSKLTLLLSECLQSARTFLLATISPALGSIDETLTTLRLAQAVRSITTRRRRGAGRGAAAGGAPEGGPAESEPEAAAAAAAAVAGLVEAALPSPGSVCSASSLSAASSLMLVGGGAPEPRGVPVPFVARLCAVEPNGETLCREERQAAHSQALAQVPLAPCALSSRSLQSTATGSSSSLGGERTGRGEAGALAPRLRAWESGSRAGRLL